MREAWTRFLAIFKKRGLDREFDDEVQSHIALAIEDYVQRGVPLAQAQRLARVDFGSIEVSKEAHRDSRGLPWLEGIFYDLRFVLRGLRRDRAFTIAAIAMLALAIGLNVTVFTVMDAMLFRGYPLVKRNDRLVHIQERAPSGMCCISYADFEDWRAQAHSFQGLAFVGEKVAAFREGEGRASDEFTFLISANTFGLLGVPPMLGRDFVPADGIAGAPPVVILNYRFWKNRFGERADVIGSTVHYDGAPVTIIGVMPKGFDFPTEANLWMPLAPTYQRGLTRGGFLAVGRLKDGTSAQKARAELETINRRLEIAWPSTNRGVVAVVTDNLHWGAGPNGPVIYGTLWAGACFVLLIACANLTNLTLVRTLGRSREFSTRIALGAGHARMMRQIFMEGLALASVSGALGWWIAKWSMRTWAAATASRFQILDYRVDSGTIFYLVAISVAAAILLSLAPVSRVFQFDVNLALKGGGQGVTQGRRGKHLGAWLVAGQMALAIVLLSGAGVLVRSLVNIVGANTGVRDPEHILAGLLRFPSVQYPDAGYFDRVQTRLKGIPGIQDTSVASSLPVGSGILETFEIQGRSVTPDDGESAQFLSVGSDYFRVVGASILSGHNFSEGDGSAALQVAIVNQSFADRFFPGEQPLGKRIRAPSRFNALGEWRTVVGVVSNVMQGDPTRQHFKPLIYLPFQQGPPVRVAYFLARAALPPGQVAQAVRAEIRKIDPDVNLEKFTTLKDDFAFDRDYTDVDHMELGKDAATAPIFAVIALLLAAIGLYAVIAHSTSQRTKEIGVRMAIGAAAKDIRNMVLRNGMSPVVIGLTLGLAASLAVNRLLRSQLVGVPPYDPLILAGAPVVLILVALIACYIPSRRAMKVNPAVALRHD